MKLLTLLLMCLGVTIMAEGLPGGFTNQNPDNPEYKDAVDQAIALVQKDHAGLKLVKVHKLATQVVAGLNYLIIAELQSNDQKLLWQIVAYQDFSKEISLTSARQIWNRKFIKNIVGGFTEQNPDSNAITKVATQAVKEIANEGKLVKVYKAATQIVAGTNYLLVMELQVDDNTFEVWEVIVYNDLSGNTEITDKKNLTPTE